MNCKFTPTQGKVREKVLNLLFRKLQRDCAAAGRDIRRTCINIVYMLVATCANIILARSYDITFGKPISNTNKYNLLASILYGMCTSSLNFLLFDFYYVLSRDIFVTYVF